MQGIQSTDSQSLNILDFTGNSVSETSQPGLFAEVLSEKMPNHPEQETSMIADAPANLSQVMPPIADVLATSNPIPLPIPTEMPQSETQDALPERVTASVLPAEVIRPLIVSDNHPIQAMPATESDNIANLIAPNQPATMPSALDNHMSVLDNKANMIASIKETTTAAELSEVSIKTENLFKNDSQQDKTTTSSEKVDSTLLPIMQALNAMPVQSNAETSAALSVPNVLPMMLQPQQIQQQKTPIIQTAVTEDNIRATDSLTREGNNSREQSQLSMLKQLESFMQQQQSDELLQSSTKQSDNTSTFHKTLEQGLQGITLTPYTDTVKINAASVSTEVANKVVPQLSDKVVWMTQHDIKEARLLLDPKHLGSIDIRIMMHHNEANVQFTLSNPIIKDAIQSHLPQLSAQLADAGVMLMQADVQTQQHRQSHHSASTHYTQGAQFGSAEESAVMPTMVSHLRDGLFDLYV